MELTVTRRYEFRAVHALLVGVHRERRHGHAYHVEVTCRPDFTGLDAVMRESVLPRLHGHELKDELEPATGEVIVEWIDRRLRDLGVAPLAVCLQETRKNRFVSARSEVRHV